MTDTKQNEKVYCNQNFKSKPLFLENILGKGTVHWISSNPLIIKKEGYVLLTMIANWNLHEHIVHKSANPIKNNLFSQNIRIFHLFLTHQRVKEYSCKIKISFDCNWFWLQMRFEFNWGLIVIKFLMQSYWL